MNRRLSPGQARIRRARQNLRSVDRDQYLTRLLQQAAARRGE